MDVRNPPPLPLSLSASLSPQPILRRHQLELARRPDFLLLPEVPHLLELLQADHLTLNRFRRGGVQAP